MRIPYRRRPSSVPNTTNSRKGKVIADTEFLKLLEKRSPVQKAQPGMPPRARKSQPKSLQHRPKSAQHLPEEPMSPKSTQCHPKATQCPRNLRSLLQVEAADPSGVGCGRSLYRVSIYKKSTLHRCKVLFLERKTGLGPATSTLARLRSTN